MYEHHRNEALTRLDCNMLAIDKFKMSRLPLLCQSDIQSSNNVKTKNIKINGSTVRRSLFSMVVHWQTGLFLSGRF